VLTGALQGLFRKHSNVQDNTFVDRLSIVRNQTFMPEITAFDGNGKSPTNQDR
jgi:hypothetical protein